MDSSHDDIWLHHVTREREENTFSMSDGDDEDWSVVDTTVWWSISKSTIASLDVVKRWFFNEIWYWKDDLFKRSCAICIHISNEYKHKMSMSFGEAT